MRLESSVRLNEVAEKSAETPAGSDFAVAEPCPEEFELSNLPRLRTVLKELVASNRGRLSLMICWDCISIFVAINAGYTASPSYTPTIESHLNLWTASIPLGIAFIVAALCLGLYERPNGEGTSALFIRCTVAAGSAWAVSLLSQYMVKYAATGRWVVIISGMVLVVLALLGRLLLRYALRRLPVNVIVLGDEQVVRSIEVDASRRPFPPLRISAVFPMACNTLAQGISDGTREVSWTVVQGKCGGDSVEALLPLLQNGTRIVDVSTFFESLFQKVPVDLIDTDWLIQANVSLVIMATRVVKRMTDILSALLGLALTLPLWPAIALGIRLTSKGPVFYTQERVGRHGKNFKILKFRTMTVDAETSGKAVWATRGDKRVTGFGNFLRKTRLDELPQFINVLLGDMSLVGPRPERPQFVQTLAEKVPHYQLRHLVRPGITGWAQINYRYAASLEDSVEKLRYDLYYVKHGGLMLDLQIMLRTVGELMRGSR